MKHKRKLISFVFLAFILLLPALPKSSAAWQTDGIPICTFTTAQQNPDICHVGNGSVIIVWEDLRAGTADIYAQMVNSSGHIQWTANGTPICTEFSVQSTPKICSDGVGGAIIVWIDDRGATTDIYAQRINATGHPQWAPNGTAICTAGNTQNKPRIIADGAEGAVIAWEDFRSGILAYAQKVNSSGHTQWNLNGMRVCPVDSFQQSPDLCSDGDGGAIITWLDGRTGNNDVYIQKINSTGTRQWDANGIVACNHNASQMMQKICTDGAGGAIVVWRDSRNLDQDIYTQRINATGYTQWIANGTAICTLVNNQDVPQIVADGTGGAVMTWHATGDPRGVRAQKVTSNGTPLWGTDGVQVATAGPTPQYYPQLCSDGAGGAIVTWRDTTADVYAQRIDVTGARQAGDSGMAVCTAANWQQEMAICNTSIGEAVIVWRDSRDSGNDNIYAQHVSIPIGEEPPNGGDNGIPLVVWIVLVIAVISAVVIILLLIRRKK